MTRLREKKSWSLTRITQPKNKILSVKVMIILSSFHFFFLKIDSDRGNQCPSGIPNELLPNTSLIGRYIFDRIEKWKKNFVYLQHKKYLPNNRLNHIKVLTTFTSFTAKQASINQKARCIELEFKAYIIADQVFLNVITSFYFTTYEN